MKPTDKNIAAVLGLLLAEYAGVFFVCSGWSYPGIWGASVREVDRNEYEREVFGPVLLSLELRP